MSNWLYSLISSVIKLSTGLGVIAIYARYLTIDDYAVVAISLLIGQIITIILDAGINSEILTTNISSTSNLMNERLAESVSVKIFLCIPITIIFAQFINIDGYYSFSLFFFTALSVPVAASIENYSIALKTRNIHGVELIISILQSIVVIASSFLLIEHADFAAVIIILPRLLLLLLIICFLYRTNWQIFYQSLSPKKLKNYFLRGRHFSIDSIASNISNQTDGIAVSLFLGKDIYGLYQPISRLLMAGIALGGAVAGVAIPKSRNMHENTSKKKYLFKVFTLTGIITSVGILFFLSVLIEPIFGDRFKVDFQLSLLIASLMLLKYVSAGVGAYLSLQGKQKIRALVNFYSLLISLFLIFLIEKSVNNIICVLLISQFFILSYYELTAKKYK